MVSGTVPRSREAQEELRAQILANPEEGWRTFLSEFGPLLRSLIRKFGLSPEDQEEVFQEVTHTLIRNNYRAFRAWEHEKSSLSNYIAVITIRATVSFTKSAYYQHTLKVQRDAGGTDGTPSILALLESPTRNPRDRLDRIHTAEAFETILDRLLEKGTLRREDHQLLLLRLRGLSYREIEPILGLSVETLTSRFTRLKPILKSALVSQNIRSDTLG